MTTPKLKDAPIVEALLEIQFESAEIPEIVIGRLSDLALWRDGIKGRLNAELPPAIKQVTPQLRHLPALEIKGVNGVGAVRIGSNVTSLHFVGPYSSWEDVFPLMSAAIDEMFKILPTLKVTRLGLRYINLFTSSRHGVHAFSQLAIKIDLAQEPLVQPINLTFSEAASKNHVAMTKVISREFLAGDIPQDASVAVDVDVYTPVEYLVTTPEVVKAWVSEAHDYEHAAFVKLLPPDLYAQLRLKEH